MVCYRIFVYLTQWIIFILFAIIIVYLPNYGQGEQNAYLLNERFFFVLPIVFSLLITTLSLKLFERNTKLKINILDILVFFYFSYCIYSYFHIARYSGGSGKLLEIFCVAALYLAVRLVNEKKQITILYLLILSGICQATYGLLQLYGFYPSNHPYFKLTGGFFNPGPYGGYLAAIWPIALTIYLFKTHFYFVSGGQSNEILNSPKKVSIHPSILKIVWVLTLKNRILPCISIYIQVVNQKKYVDFLSKLLVNYLPLFCLIAIVIVLPTSKSRAAWISVFSTTVLLLLLRYKISSKIKTRGLKLIIYLAFVLFTIGFFLGGFYLKKDSANGRLLIWKACVPMIIESPFTGVGYGKFTAHYMDFQANYLLGKENTPEALLADNVIYTYNTLLKILTELGVLGLMPALIVLSIIIRTIIKQNKVISQLNIKNSSVASCNYENDNPTVKLSAICLLGIFFVGMFSYPEQVLSLKIFFIICLGVFASSFKSKGSDRLTFFSNSKGMVYSSSLRKSLMITFILLLTVTCPQIFRLKNQLKQSYSSWQDANYLYGVSEYSNSLEDFESAFKNLKNNGLFLLQYGKALSITNNHNKAIEILKLTELHLKNSFLYTAMGDSYKALGLNNDAERSYKIAINQVPNRFYTKYKLFKLYVDTSDDDKAERIANQILTQEVKVQSSAIFEIKTKVINYLNNTNLKNSRR